MIVLAEACVPDNSCSKKDASIHVEGHESDLHALISLGVPEAVVLQDHSHVHEWVGTLRDEHAHHDEVSGHIISQRQRHADNTDSMVDNHGFVK